MSKQLYCYFNKIQSYIVFSDSKSFFLLSSCKSSIFVTDSLVGVP